LGAANYTVYDQDGIAVTGLTESGITADGNGLYQIAPVSAVSKLLPGKHYVVKVGIVVDGQERITYKGIQVLE
jgi:hypothetical protein